MRRRIRAIARAAFRWRRGRIQTRIAPAKPAIPGAIDYAAWLIDGVLIASGWMELVPGSTLDAAARIGGTSFPLEVKYASYQRPDVPTPQGGKILILYPLSADLLAGAGSSITLSTEHGALVIEGAAIAKALMELPTALASGLGWLTAESRQEVLNFIASVLMDGRQAFDSMQLHKSLLAAREALNTDLKVQNDGPDFHVDALLAVDDKSFYVRGWMSDRPTEITGVALVSPEGQRLELYESLRRYRRADVERVRGSAPGSRVIGFSAYAEFATACRPAPGWNLEIRHAAREAVRVMAPAVITDLVAVRDSVLRDITFTSLPDDALIRSCIFPAIAKLQERHQRMSAAESVYEFGKSKPAPDVSIIIPLYRRIDFLEHQMAQFCHDSEIGDEDILYVLDSPELAQELCERALQIFRLYQVPFRVVVLNQNAGFSSVNNIGCSFARGRLIILLNSDVFPIKPGWVGRMKHFYRSTPRIGALGPKLLYEDDSLQHAGMYFYRPVGMQVWENQHYFKGLHRTFPGANVTRRVPAVTAACLMIDRELYQQMGGLRGIYVQGDYEDSDLCLRLLEAGYENWYLPEVELYHLEGQSYPSAERRMASRYNAWLHTHLWNEKIEEVMTEYSSAPVEVAIR